MKVRMNIVKLCKTFFVSMKPKRPHVETVLGFPHSVTEFIGLLPFSPHVLVGVGAPSCLLSTSYTLDWQCLFLEHFGRIFEELSGCCCCRLLVSGVRCHEMVTRQLTKPPIEAIPRENKPVGLPQIIKKSLSTLGL
jgi:hypothetical protein